MSACRGTGFRRWYHRGIYYSTGVYPVLVILLSVHGRWKRSNQSNVPTTWEPIEWQDVGAAVVLSAPIPPYTPSKVAHMIHDAFARARAPTSVTLRHPRELHRCQCLARRECLDGLVRDGCACAKHDGPSWTSVVKPRWSEGPCASVTINNSRTAHNFHKRNRGASLGSRQGRVRHVGAAAQGDGGEGREAPNEE